MNPYLNNILDFFRTTNPRSDLEKRLLELNRPKVQEEDFDFKSEVLDWVSNLSKYDFQIPRYSKVERLFLNILYESGQIKDSQIDESLKSHILKSADHSYKLLKNRDLKKSSIDVDSILINQSELAYAITNQIYSFKQLEEMGFSKKNNLFDFLFEYGNRNLIPNLRNKLLNPELLVKKTPKKQLELFQEKKPSYGGHCCCCC